MATLLFFAQFKDITGKTKISIDAKTVGEAIAFARQSFGTKFEELLLVSKVWLDGDEVPLDTELSNNSELAFLPPVSGG
ncbi:MULTISPECIES: MoaD/ThiS family protein [Acidithrix]|uniref:Molybdopterin synthase small subunit n=1 Tax=Acidithrix ferrooxidans TaxID=1280514 RepID=A0A0D8HF39_9ACTN|nr:MULTISPECIES: MoaD/ThiS family protein [Acidithrix]KJF16538.1 molybdopterin synthase small subunit [Acidithrix ferrooxidans]